MFKFPEPGFFLSLFLSLFFIPTVEFYAGLLYHSIGKMARQAITYILFWVLIFTFISPLWSLDPHKTVNQYILDSWGIENGLPSNSVITITQTKNGYLWIGTTKGLVRYDGTTFKKICFTGKEEIDSQDIRALYVDGDGVIWVGIATGLIRYDHEGRKVKYFTADDGITPDGVRSITRDSSNSLWIGFEANFASRFAKSIFTPFNNSHGLMGKKVNAIFENRAGQLLFLTRHNGIFRYENESFLTYPLPGLFETALVNFMEDRSGALWIQSLTGLYRADIQNGKINGKQVFTDEKIWVTAFTIDSHENIWVGMTNGLKRLKINQEGKEGNYYIHQTLLDNLSINCLFEDREKNLWIGMDNSGLRRLKDGKFSPYVPFEPLERETPVSLFRDRNGDTWIGTLSGTLFHCRNNRILNRSEIPALPGTSITAITGDDQGNLWLGTTSKGVYRYGKTGFERFTTKDGLADNVADNAVSKGVYRYGKTSFKRFTTKDGLADNAVTSIYNDGSGRLWFSTYGGVSVRDPKTGQIRPIKTGMTGSVVNNVIQSQSGAIWIATKQGIVVKKRVKKGTGEKEGEKEGNEFYLNGIPIGCIYEDPNSTNENGLFWITTAGHGLKRLTLPGGNITTYTTAHGMTTNFIYQLLEDSRGNFWCTSNNGVLRVSKDELNRMAEGNQEEINCISFGFSDGLKSLEFDNQYSTHSVLDNGGEFWFITREGISIVKPGRIELNQTPPPVVIEEVRVNLKPHLFSRHERPVSFRGVSHLSFHFTAPTFLSPSKTKFRYRLPGINRDWIYLLPGQERAAYFKDPPPGEYTFEVSACNAGGKWKHLSGDSFKFTIVPLFYQTSWFKPAIIIFFLGLSAALIILARKRKTGKENNSRYKSSSLSPEFADECLTKLKYLMEVEKIYYDADLSLQGLAEKLSTQPWVLSQLLNEKLNRNFSEYINRYRVEEAKRILLTPGGSKRKIYAIATSSGFNTMAAFYKAFKKYTGMTPTEFKKKSRKDGNR